MRAGIRFFAAAAALAVAPTAPIAPASAASAPFQVVTFRNMFIPAEIVLTAGSSLELTNLDLERHDVTSSDVGSNGLPLFRSKTVGPAGHTVVEGVPALEGPSIYPYYCSVHTEMVGNINVL